MNRWFVLQTNPQCEKKAAGELRRAGVRVFSPKRFYEKRNHKTGKSAVKNRPLLTGYLFVRFPSAMLDAQGRVPFGFVRKCQGVKDFLKAVDKAGVQVPFSIPNRLVVDFMRRQRDREFGRPEVDTAERVRARLERTFTKGRTMRVTSGAFVSMEALIEQLRADGSVDATIPIFGRATMIHFDQPEETLAPLVKSGEAA